MLSKEAFRMKPIALQILTYTSLEALYYRRDSLYVNLPTLLSALSNRART